MPCIMSESFVFPPVSDIFQVKMEKQPDGTYKAYFAEASTTFAFGKTEGEVFANLVIINQGNNEQDSIHR